MSSGFVDIFQVTAKHEDILSNANLLRKGTVLDEFLKALIATPCVSINDLLIGDKNAIFIAARTSAYGEIYTTNIKCPNPECGVESDVDIDLSLLVAKNVLFTGVRGENKISFVLPNSQRTVVIALLTHKDETDIDLELKALAKIGGANATSPEITTRLKFTIKSVDGDVEKSTVKNFVDTKLTARDSLALRKFVKENTPDMDMSFQFVCPECGHTEKMTVPLGANFFWPNISED